MRAVILSGLPVLVHWLRKSGRFALLGCSHGAAAGARRRHGLPPHALQGVLRRRGCGLSSSRQSGRLGHAVPRAW